MNGRVLRWGWLGVAAAALLAVAGFPPGRASATTLPGPPTGAVASPRDQGALVSWKAPSVTGGSPITGYVITATPGQQTVITRNVTAYLVGGLSNGTAYQFTVAAITTAGTGPASTPSAAVTPEPPTAPGQVRSLTVTAGFGQATASWTPPAGSGGSPVTAYKVTAEPGGTQVAVQGDITQATVTGLTDGTSYTLSVLAVNAVGAGPAVVSGPVVPTVTAPGAPGSVQASSTGSGVLVGWAPAASDGGSAITGYTVTSSPAGGTAATGPSATSVTVTGLTPGTAYTFTVTATNGVGTGPGITSAAVTPNTTVPSTTVVLSAASLAALTTVNTNGSLVFTNPPAQVTSLQSGDVVAAGTSAATPNGLLAKVTSVATSGSTTTVDTVPASLDQAVSAGGFATGGTLVASGESSSGRVRFIPARPGVKLARPTVSPSGGLSLIINTKLYDDGHGDAITVTGNASLTPYASFGAQVNCCFSVNTQFKAGVQAQAALTLSAQSSHQISGGYDLGTLKFPNIVFDVGPVPVVVSPELDVTLVADGNVLIGVTASASASANLGVNVTTHNADVSASPIHQLTTSYTPPVLYGTVDARAGVQARLKFLVYGYAGPYLQDTIWPIELSASTSANPWWTLTLENQVGAGFTLEVFGNTLVDWNDPSILDSKITLTTAGGPFQQVTITPNPAAVAPGGSVQLTAAVGGAPRPVTWGTPSGGTITPGGLYTAPGIPGTYQVPATSPGSGLAPPAYGIADVCVGSLLPGPPTSVTATAEGPGQAIATWTAPSHQCGTPVTTYQVTSTPASGTHTATAPATSLTINRLTGGTTYTFTVVAINSAGGSLPSGPSNQVLIYGIPPQPNSWAWGDDSTGELGDGGATNGSDVPVQVPGLTGVTAIASGNEACCSGQPPATYALLSNGTVWGWGDNSIGQLGDGTIGGIDTPVQVKNLTGVTAIVGGHQGGYALRSDGTVWAWGANNEGQLGDGTVTTAGCQCSNVPVQVKNLTGATAIAGIHDSGYALLANGTVRAWGYNLDGELGNGTTSTTGCQCSDVPVQVKDLTGVTAIAASSFSGYALLSNGTEQAWGYNADGQLGNLAGSTTACSCSDVPVRVGSLAGVGAITGSDLSGYALLSDGTVQAWGFNAYGGLGDGTVSTTGCQCRFTPVLVKSLTGVTAIAGGDYNGGYALMSDGTVRAWGWNARGELGDGTIGTTGCRCSDVPVQVLNLGNVSGIAGGAGDGYALQRAG